MINKLMQKYGYILTQENKYGAYYEKQEKQGFIHVVCIIGKASGNHIMQSYDKNVLEVDEKYINEGCGVDIPILLLMWLKAKYLNFKYNWTHK